MAKRNWKRVRPTSLRKALELCKDYAKDVHNLSVEQIAERMGLSDHWALYKWIASGRMPAVLIRPFEHACGCHFVTQWIASSAHKLLIDIPKGKPTSDADLNELQASITDAVGKLIRFYSGMAEADETVAGLTDVMASLAYHRQNVAMKAAPELDLFGEGSDHD